MYFTIDKFGVTSLLLFVGDNVLPTFSGIKLIRIDYDNISVTN